MKIFIGLVAALSVVQTQEILDESCGIMAVMMATTRLTQAIKGTNFPDSSTDAFYEEVCDMYQAYLDTIDLDSEKCHNQILDSLRVVARVGAFYHQISGRCPGLTYSKLIDENHFYEVYSNDMALCRELRGDDSCVVNWVQSIKNGDNTCEIYRRGIKCHREWFDSNCIQPNLPLPTTTTGFESALVKANDDLLDALNHLEGLQPDNESCRNMTP